IEFATYTLRYNKMHWLTIDGIGEHWSQARVSAAMAPSEVAIDAENVTDVSLSFDAGQAPFNIGDKVTISINDDEVEVPGPKSDKSWEVSLHRARGQWRLGKRDGDQLRKRHGVQGPIDDAFLDRFIFVRPTGKAWNDDAGKWAASELDRAIEHWRRQFRGVA